MARAHTISLLKNAGAVRLSMPASVANDLKGLQNSLRSLADRLGHSNCATGCDFLQIGQEREFVISERFELNPQPLPPSMDDMLAFAADRGLSDRTVVVTVPESVNNNIEQLTGAVAAVMDKLGCAPCCSGFDILFRREFDHFAVNDRLEVTGRGVYR